MRKIIIPNEVEEAVQRGATLAVSISGGKDSQAMLYAVMAWYREEKLTNPIFAIHADLGRVEWKETASFVEQICEEEKIPLVIVRRIRNGKVVDLLDRIIERKEKLDNSNKPFWPSAQQRYCTSDLKSQPINEYLRKFDDIISVEGIRWQESKARSEKPRVKIRTEIETKKRRALTWNPIIDWLIEDVWESGGQSKRTYEEAQVHYKKEGKVPEWWNFHPAYAMGNHRLSCAICVLADMNDVVNGVRHNPELADAYQKLEEETGFTFRQGFSIAKAREKLKQGTLEFVQDLQERSDKRRKRLEIF